MQAQSKPEYHGRAVVIAGVGHIMYLEKPAEFSRLTISFIEQNSNGLEGRPNAAGLR